MPGIDEYTKLCLHCNGTDGSTSFPDASENNYTVTAVADAQVDDAIGKFNESALMDGVGDYLLIEQNANFDPGTDDFTIDWWEYATTNSHLRISRDAGESSTYSGFTVVGNPGIIYMSSNGISWDIAVGRSLGSVTQDTWVHYAIVRFGNTFYTFKGGVQQDTWTSSLGIYAGQSGMRLGIDRSGYTYFTGNADEIRFSKGIARWTSGFTPPTEEYSFGVDESDTITLSDEIELNISLEKAILNDTITLSDDIDVESSRLDDVITLNEDLYITRINPIEKEESITLSEEIEIIPSYNDIGLIIRTKELTLDDLYCDIRAYNGTIEDVGCDIRILKSLEKDDLACDIRVKPISDNMVGLDGIKIKLAGSWLDDVDTTTLNCNWQSDDTIGTANFRLARYSDDYNRTLEASSSALDSDSIVEVYFDDDLIWYGYIVSVQPTLDGEEVNVLCYDRKHRIHKEMQDMSYGRTGDYETTGSALTYILDDLVTKGIIASYTGIPTGIVTELNEQEGTPVGSLITEILDLTGNYKWNVTPDGVLKIYKSGAGTTKHLPLASSDNHLNRYDVIDYSFTVNDKIDLVTSLEVVLGTESSRSYDSYRIVSLEEKQLNIGWNNQHENDYVNNIYVRNIRLRESGQYLGDLQASGPDHRDIFRKFEIPGWTEGSFLDPTFKPKVGVPKPVYWKQTSNPPITRVKPLPPHELPVALQQAYNDNLLTMYEKHVINSDGTIAFTRRQFIPTVTYYDSNLWGYTIDYINQWLVFKPIITCRYYKKQTIEADENPTIFDVEYIGNAGTGQKRKAVFSSLMIRDSIAWRAYEDGELVYKNEPGYDDKSYAIDRAKLMLSRLNDAKTEGTIDLTFDAWKYYGIDIGNRLNINNTKYTDIYNGSNGFPLDVNSINFNANDYRVTLNVKHEREYVATENYR